MAWIETTSTSRERRLFSAVATREGGVDRNQQLIATIRSREMSPPARVAWIETLAIYGQIVRKSMSPPARVAWIETASCRYIGGKCVVATREGGVDRNLADEKIGKMLDVATREGGVDRNTSSRAAAVSAAFCRHPRGWRG